jgi:hypothetical protein
MLTMWTSRHTLPYLTVASFPLWYAAVPWWKSTAVWLFTPLLTPTPPPSSATSTSTHCHCAALYRRPSPAAGQSVHSRMETCSFTRADYRSEASKGKGEPFPFDTSWHFLRPVLYFACDCTHIHTHRRLCCNMRRTGTALATWSLVM